jgi:hypothetical protein
MSPSGETLQTGVGWLVLLQVTLGTVSPSQQLLLWQPTSERASRAAAI